MINNPSDKTNFDNIVKGLKQFRQEFHGRLALQIMFINENKRLC